MKPAIFYANARHLVPNKLIVRYGVLGAVRPLTSAFVRTNAMLAKTMPESEFAQANSVLAKTLPSQQFQIHMLYLPEARILIFKTLVFFFQKVTIHGHGLASIAM